MSTTTTSAPDPRPTAHPASASIRHLMACAVHLRGLPGGGLQGRSAIQVVMSVSDADGAPVTGLRAPAFALTPIPAGAGDAPHALRPRDVTDFREVVAGVYTITTDSHGLTHVLLLTVADDARGQARMLLRVDA